MVVYVSFTFSAGVPQTELAPILYLRMTGPATNTCRQYPGRHHLALN